MFARAHQRQLHLILNVFNLNNATLRQASCQGSHNFLCQALNGIANGAGGGNRTAFGSQKGFHHGVTDFLGLEIDDFTGAAHDFEMGRAAFCGNGRVNAGFHGYSYYI